MGGVQLKGTAELQILAVRLKAAGDRGLTNRMRKEMRVAAKPIGDEVMIEGANRMPSGGGLRSHLLATKKVTLNSSFGGRVVRVALSLRGGSGPRRYELERIDREGRVRHPVYGHMASWSATRVFPGAWTKAFRLKRSKLRKAVLKAANDTLDDVARGL